MSEEILFDCLHAEIVNYCLDSNKVGTRGTQKKISHTTDFDLVPPIRSTTWPLWSI